MKGKPRVVVHYEPDETACAAALEVLLKKRSPAAGAGVRGSIDGRIKEAANGRIIPAKR